MSADKIVKIEDLQGYVIHDVIVAYDHKKIMVSFNPAAKIVTYDVIVWGYTKYTTSDLVEALKAYNSF